MIFFYGSSFGSTFFKGGFAWVFGSTFSKGGIR